MHATGNDAAGRDIMQVWHTDYLLTRQLNLIHSTIDPWIGSSCNVPPISNMYVHVLRKIHFKHTTYVKVSKARI